MSFALTEISPNQFGFIPARQGTELVSGLRQVIEKASDCGQSLHIDKTDTSNAFDRLGIGAIEKGLRIIWGITKTDHQRKKGGRAKLHVQMR